MSEKKELTPEQIEAREAKKVERNEAKTLIRSFAKECEDDALKKALLLIVGSGTRKSGGSTRVNVNALIREAFIEEKEISEMDLFMKFKVGRPEMTTKIRIMLKTPNIEDRVWVKFYDDEEVYRVEGIGAEAPEGWDGFTPVDEEIL